METIYRKSILMSKKRQPEFNKCIFKPRTNNQTEYVRLMAEHAITFCTGPAGCGKTCCAVGLAVEHLLDSKVSKIVITRPTVHTDTIYDTGIGYLPGDLREKMNPYLTPIMDELEKYLDKYSIESYIQEGIIDIAPLQFMRGRTFHNAFIILDE